MHAKVANLRTPAKFAWDHTEVTSVATVKGAVEKAKAGAKEKEKARTRTKLSDG